MKFIGQIRLNDFYHELEDLTLAYIFLTQPEDRSDTFFDPDIIFPDEGENAVIIQPEGKIPEYIHIENFLIDPTVDSKTIWVPKTTEIKERATTELEEIYINKFCGIPAFFKIVKLVLIVDYCYSYIQIGCHFTWKQRERLQCLHFLMTRKMRALS